VGRYRLGLRVASDSEPCVRSTHGLAERLSHSSGVLTPIICSYDGSSSKVGGYYEAAFGVEAESFQEAESKAVNAFRQAAKAAGLPPWPMSKGYPQDLTG
jgi:hypothetical protein